jgi:hypothetical protein
MNKSDRLASRIPITDWFELDRRMAIISRMSTESSINKKRKNGK